MVSRNLPDLSLIQGGVWEQATFTVPNDVADERVQSPIIADKYQRKFGKNLESSGFDVKWMSDPMIDRTNRPIDEDRRGYIIQAWVKRRPVELLMEIPDENVPELEAMGMRLKE